MVNSRANSEGIRYSHISSNEGKDWLTKQENDLIDPGCNASFIKYNYGKYKRKGLLILSSINNSKIRKEIVVRYSLDEGESWSKPKIVYSGEAAYSSMTILKNGEIDLIITGEGMIDDQTAHGKLVSGVSHLAKKFKTSFKKRKDLWFRTDSNEHNSLL